VIGRSLDKYEILEEVGQGGMSVVYRGRDTVLKRDVAIKVLHHHLASHEEARHRFEREAQAVAKLRHDNILEIFDYSGRGSTDSYIVTEFISGRTLKDFITRQKIAYPEIAGMIVVEVCRALAHAHGLGVLHRDVKPENIMVRDDGRLKLMDFGIAQVIDTQRMTVTGQLLGSPAYMSPEHVEGKPLDFRTDIFSVGILLYQLATGELPFKGRNPHEILKKIAECKYLDARVVNPFVGERLGKIIAKAMARAPEDRFQDVRGLTDDLGRYLAEADLADPREELARYFQSPVSYEQALRQRLIAALTARGKAELAEKRVGAALELYNRVLTIDPANEAVLAEIDKMSRRRRALRGVGLVALVSAIGALAFVLKLAWPSATVASPAGAIDAGSIAKIGDAGAPLGSASGTGISADAAPGVALPETSADAGETAARPSPDAEPDPLPLRPGRADAGPKLAARGADAGVPVAGGPSRRIRFTTKAKASTTWSIDGGPAVAFAGGIADIDVPAGKHTVTIRHPRCFDETVSIGADDDRDSVYVPLRYRPRQVRLVCPAATSVLVNGRPWPQKTVYDVDFGNGDKESVTVDFGLGGRVVTRRLDVTPGETPLEVTCDGP
jgi:serine/threonine-protein kinase